MPHEPLSYAASGVNIDEAGRALQSVLPAIRATQGARVVAGVGSFGALFDGTFSDLRRPLLVSSIDGVGTKTKVAGMAGQWDGIGHDIVNHCANDILCQGARPLFFLDYFGCSHLSAEVFQAVVGGAAAACGAIGCALIGGETAEMPGVYHDDEVDVVGSMIGVVDEELALPRPNLEPGDTLIGLASDGLHTNGYSMARRAFFEIAGLSVNDHVPGEDRTIAEALLTPHRCYANALLPLINEGSILGLAHITGGGLIDNLPRVLPSHLQAVVHRDRWEPPRLFRAIQEIGQVSEAEMYRAFNMGFGMVVVTRADVALGVAQRLNDAGEQAFVIGELTHGSRSAEII